MIDSRLHHISAPHAFHPSMIRTYTKASPEQASHGQRT